jgi:hypothetical protein
MGLMNWDLLPEELRNSLRECYQKYENHPVFKKDEQSDETDPH